MLRILRALPVVAVLAIAGCGDEKDTVSEDEIRVFVLEDYQRELTQAARESGERGTARVTDMACAKSSDREARCTAQVSASVRGDSATSPVEIDVTIGDDGAILWTASTL